MIGLLLCATVGATLLVVSSTAFKPIRRIWPALFQCGQCVGMWVGGAVGGSGLISTGNGRALDAIIVGCATSFLALLAHAVLLQLLGDVNE